MIEEVVEAPENLLKPENLSGKLILGKAQLWPKLWVKNWGLYANLNIFSKVMSIEQRSTYCAALAASMKLNAPASAWYRV